MEVFLDDANCSLDRSVRLVRSLWTVDLHDVGHYPLVENTSVLLIELFELFYYLLFFSAHYFLLGFLKLH